MFIFIISILAAIVTVVFLIILATYLADYFSPFYRIFSLLHRTVGVQPLVILTGILLFIVYFFALSQRSIRYLEEISHNLKEVAGGQFDISIPVRSTDELGVLAENINFMTSQVKSSIQEERNAERAKNELITSVSHDLRTPLTSILGYLGLIVNDRYRDEIVLRYYADIAYSKSLRLKNLIDELFEYTRVSYGGMKMNLQRLNIVELMNQLVEDFTPLLEESDMTCHLFSSKKEVFAWVDANMIVRVFENLISNGIRYGKDGKKLDIKIEEKEDILISMISYGDPIPSKDLPYLFDRFYRVEKSRSQEMGGTGLGLAIAKSIVELHNGKINVHSNSERTVFEIKLSS